MCTQIIIIIFEDIDRVIHNIEITQAKLGEGQQFFLQVFLKFPDFYFYFCQYSKLWTGGKLFLEGPRLLNPTLGSTQCRKYDFFLEGVIGWAKFTSTFTCT